MRCAQSTVSGVAASVGANEHAENIEKVSHVGTERALRAVASSSGIPQFMDESGAVWCAEDVCAAHINPRPAV
jgi:hypothetical protein